MSNHKVEKFDWMKGEYGVKNEMNIKLSYQSSIIDLSVLNLIETIEYDYNEAFSKEVLGNSQLINFKI